MFGRPLANYRITWHDPSDQAVVIDFDPKTDANGEATATVKGTIEGLARFDVVAADALATCDFSYDFVEQALSDYSVLASGDYAHNPPKGSHVNPADDSQVITFTFRYLLNGVPQPNKQVIWYFSPATSDLYFFDAKNSQIFVLSAGHILTTTDENGLSVVKVGSLSRFLGTVNVGPYDDTSANFPQFSIVIATFNPVDGDQILQPAIYSPQPIDIPDHPSSGNSGFQLYVSGTGTILHNHSVVFWISSGEPGKTKQEHIKIVPLDAAKDGVTVPYSDVYPDPAQLGNNTIAYMVVARDTSSSNLSKAVSPDVIGSPALNYPDYGNNNRTLPSPHLFNYANVVNGNGITNGLTVYIPYSPTWVAGNTINLKLYLNGFNNKNVAIGNTLIYAHIITDAEKSAESDITVLIKQEELSGYYRGTLESDYYIGNNWSVILENITLETGNWH